MRSHDRAGRHRAAAPPAALSRVLRGAAGRPRRGVLLPAAVAVAGISAAALVVTLGQATPDRGAAPVEAIRDQAATSPSERGPAPMTSTNPTPTLTGTGESTGAEAPAGSGTAAPSPTRLTPTGSTAVSTAPSAAPTAPSAVPTAIPTATSTPTAEPSPAEPPEVLPGAEHRPPHVPVPSRRPTP